MEQSWKTSGHYRRPIWRVLRDIFDDTVYIRAGRKIAKQNKKSFRSLDKNTYLIGDSILPAVIPKKQEITPITQSEFIHATKAEDYIAANDENTQVVTIPVQNYYFIPVPSVPAIRIERLGRRVITINIDKYMPKIKFKLVNLKRLALLSAIACLITVIFVSAFVGYRVVSLTDGDFVGEFYRAKIGTFEHDLVIPLQAQIEQLQYTVKRLDAMQDVKDWREQVSYKQQPPKVINIYRNGKLSSTKLIVQ